MTTELTYAERVSQLAHAIYATGALDLPLSDRINEDCHDAARAVLGSGWVSPEEAKAREAAARREALLEAREDIRARRRTFSDLNADPQYLAAMSDAFGLVNNRIAEPDRDVECIASPHVNSQTG
jgi:hypothetical protein